MEGDSGIVMEDVCGDDMRNLGERLVLMLMRAGILVSGVVVVVVGVMVMVEVGVVSFSEGRCLPVAEVEFVVVSCGLVGGDFFKFGGGVCGGGCGRDGGGLFKVGGSCCC